MPRKSFTPEQVIAELRHIEVALANGKTLPQACKEATISTQSYYRWRKEVRWSADHAGEEIQRPRAGEHAAEEAGGRIVAREGDAQGVGRPKLVSPERRRQAVTLLQTVRCCGAPGVPSGGADVGRSALPADGSSR